MNGKKYLENQIPVFCIHLLGMCLLSLFLLAVGNTIHSVLFIFFLWILLFGCSVFYFYRKRKKELNSLIELAEQLEECYLLPEIMKVPSRAEEEVFYQLMKKCERSMLEKIGNIQRERKEYKEYIEQWVHEVKTPITAIKLLCENQKNSFSRELLTELEQINHFTEQALYYARSEQVEKDYRICEVDLEEIVHAAISDYKYLLRQKHAEITVDVMKIHVYTDEKWVRFILNQIIGNAVKYCIEEPKLQFFISKRDNLVILSVQDNGIGIAKSDLPRIFDKGFTGENGRIMHSSTGIGLYLCKRLCDKIGIGLQVNSTEKGTTIMLCFSVNDYIKEIQI